MISFQIKVSIILAHSQFWKKNKSDEQWDKI